MRTVNVIYENGVFRPLEPVSIDESTLAQVVVPDAGQADAGPERLYEILERRYNSGHADTAARHNEHQP